MTTKIDCGGHEAMLAMCNAGRVPALCCLGPADYADAIYADAMARRIAAMVVA
jgi:hypothetical protein